MAKEQQGLTQIQYARSRGISSRYVRVLTRRNIVILLPNGRIDAEASDRMREECVAPRMRPDECRPVDLKDIERRLGLTLG